LSAHHIGFTLEGRIVIDGHPTDLPRGLHPSLLLLDDMPGFVRQVIRSSWAHVNIRALRVRQRLHFGGLAGVVVDMYIIQRQAGERFNTRL
jgi:hypothetical protein